jgi:hypothetical protein
MFNILADFEWYRDPRGYRIAPFGSLVPPDSPWMKSTAQDAVLWIVPNGKRDGASEYKPFAKRAELCSAFASVKTQQALLNFVKDHGLLIWRPMYSQSEAALAAFPALAELPAGEPVPVGLANAEMFRELLQLQALGNSRKLASHFETKIAGFVGGGQAGSVEILPDSEKGIRLKITPPNLLGALWYQLALKLSDAEFRMCPLCHRVFEVGRGSGLRADAKFCCQEHKIEYFNRKRSKRKRR